MRTKRKYFIAITLNGMPYMPYDKPLSKRALPKVNGVISFYVQATIFDATHGTILGTGHSPQRKYKDRKEFLDAAPWRTALKYATSVARGRLIYLASKQRHHDRTTVDRRKKHTRIELGGTP